MARQLHVAAHLTLTQVKEKLRTAVGFRVRKWLIVWNALVDPRPAPVLARHLGVSVDTVYQTLSRYNRRGPAALETPGRGGRRRCYLSEAEERAWLQPFLDQASRGELTTAGELQAAFAARVGQPVAPSTIYRLLARHDWRKLLPRPAHPEADPAAQEVFKKTSLPRSQQS
jgi:transposase